MINLDNQDKLDSIGDVLKVVQRGLKFPGRAVGSFSFDYEDTKHGGVLVIANYTVGGESFRVKAGEYPSLGRAKEVIDSVTIRDLMYRIGSDKNFICDEKKDNKQYFTITHDPNHKGFNYAKPKGGYEVKFPIGNDSLSFKNWQFIEPQF